MFDYLITNPVPPLTKTYFDTINRPIGECDYSLSCLGVALLKPRIENYRGISGQIDVNLMPVEDVLNLINTNEAIRSSASEQTLYETPCVYYIICNRSFDIKDFKDKISEELEQIKPIEAFIAQELGCKTYLAFKSRKTKAVYIITPAGDVRLYHLTWAFFPLMFGEYFEENKLTAIETSLLKSLTNKTQHKFYDLIAQILQPMKAELLRTEMSLCFKGFRQKKIDRQMRIVNDLRDTINSTLNEYHELMGRLEEANIVYEGLKVVNSDANNKEEEEIISYVATCPRLHFIQYNEGVLRFTVDSLLTNFDVQKWNYAVRNNNIYNGYRIAENSPFYDIANRKILLNALFGEANPKLSVRLSGTFDFDISRAYANVQRSCPVNDEVLDNCLYNPHYELHVCPGRNRDSMIQCLRSADIISAIECAIAATGSVNIGETDLTFRPFVMKILASDKKIIQRNDGVNMTPAEALLWLLKERNNNEETQAESGGQGEAS